MYTFCLQGVTDCSNCPYLNLRNNFLTTPQKGTSVEIGEQSLRQYSVLKLNKVKQTNKQRNSVPLSFEINIKYTNPRAPFLLL